MAICSVLIASPAGGHTALVFFHASHSKWDLWATNSCSSTTVASCSGANFSQNGLLSWQACHFIGPVGKPVAFQFWFQLSEEKGLSSASRPAPQISPLLRRESSQCPIQSLSSNRTEPSVPSTGASKFQQDFLMHLFLCPVPSFSVLLRSSGLPGESAASSPPPPVAGQLCASALSLAGGSQPAEESPSLKTQILKNSLPPSVFASDGLPSLSWVKTYLFNQPLVSQGKPCKFPPPCRLAFVLTSL